MFSLLCHCAVTDTKNDTPHYCYCAEIWYYENMPQISNYSPTRKLCDIEKLLKTYNVENINVAYITPDDPKNFITIPPALDLLIQLKVWIAYDTKTDELSFAKRLIGVNNYWLTQLSDDHKNKRIDLTEYIYD